MPEQRLGRSRRALQQAVPLIGFLGSRSREEASVHTAAFVQGLKAFGYFDGKTAKIEYRWASGNYERLPALARELALQPGIMVTGGGAPAAHAAASTEIVAEP